MQTEVENLQDPNLRSKQEACRAFLKAVLTFHTCSASLEKSNQNAEREYQLQKQVLEPHLRNALTSVGICTDCRLTGPVACP
jgi:hypothetical protein